jgi:hypothetical protein
MPARGTAVDPARPRRPAMRGPRLARMVAATAAVALVLALAPIQAMAQGSSVDPATYVHSVCTTLTSYKTQVSSLESSAGLANATSIADVRDKLVAFLGKVSSATSSAVTNLQNAGAPNIKNGNKIAALIVRQVSALGDAFTKAARDAQKLNTSSVNAFKRGADAIDKSVVAAGKSATRVLDAAKKRYNTKVLKSAQTADPSCQGLK